MLHVRFSEKLMPVTPPMTLSKMSRVPMPLWKYLIWEFPGSSRRKKSACYPDYVCSGLENWVDWLGRAVGVFETLLAVHPGPFCLWMRARKLGGGHENIYHHIRRRVPPSRTGVVGQKAVNQESRKWWMNQKSRVDIKLNLMKTEWYLGMQKNSVAFMTALYERRLFSAELPRCSAQPRIMGKGCQLSERCICMATNVESTVKDFVGPAESRPWNIILLLRWRLSSPLVASFLKRTILSLRRF